MIGTNFEETTSGLEVVDPAELSPVLQPGLSGYGIPRELTAAAPYPSLSDPEVITGAIASVYRFGPDKTAKEADALLKMLGLTLPDENRIRDIYNQQIFDYDNGKPGELSLAKALDNMDILNKGNLPSDAAAYQNIIDELLMVQGVGPVAAGREVKEWLDMSPVDLTEDFDPSTYIAASYRELSDPIGEESAIPQIIPRTMIDVYAVNDLLDIPTTEMPEDAYVAYV